MRSCFPKLETVSKVYSECKQYHNTTFTTLDIQLSLLEVSSTLYIDMGLESLQVSKQCFFFTKLQLIKILVILELTNTHTETVSVVSVVSKETERPWALRILIIG